MGLQDNQARRLTFAHAACEFVGPASTKKKVVVSSRPGIGFSDQQLGGTTDYCEQTRHGSSCQPTIANKRGMGHLAHIRISQSQKTVVYPQPSSQCILNRFGFQGSHESSCTLPDFPVAKKQLCTPSAVFGNQGLQATRAASHSRRRWPWRRLRNCPLGATSFLLHSTGSASVAKRIAPPRRCRLGASKATWSTSARTTTTGRWSGARRTPVFGRGGRVYQRFSAQNGIFATKRTMFPAAGRPSTTLASTKRRRAVQCSC